MFKKNRSFYLKYGFRTFLVLGTAAVLFFLSVYLGAWGKLPSRQELSNFRYQKASEVYTADSVLIGKYYLFDRQPIPYEAFPKHLVDALIAIEDKRFHEHSGVDYKSLFRVFFRTLLLQDRSSGGGSTLTQQLAKNMYPRKDREKSNLAVDKIKEMVIASRLENNYSKKEILNLYLNTVSFGDNTFGVESASLKFFNKKAKHLTIEEAAVLVGMLKATYGYNPRIFPEASRHRRNLVLQSMYSGGHLSKVEKDSLAQLPLVLNYRTFDYNEGLAPYFREEVRKQLVQWCKEQNKNGQSYNIYTSGLKIYTTLDHRMQLLAEKTMETHMKSLQRSFEKSFGSSAPWITNTRLIEKTVRNSPPYKKMVQNGLDHEQAWDSLQKPKTLVLSEWNGEKTVKASTLDSIAHYMRFLNMGSLGLDPKSGAVKSWIGGINFKHFKYDHISQSKRQVGSTFKPILYTAALEQGIGPCTYFSAQEVEYKNMDGWSPSNSDDKDETYLNYSMQEALSKSVNTVAVKVMEKTGIPAVLDQAARMGINTQLPDKPSLALGTGEIAIKELAGAYASYVNKGIPVTPMLITSITNEKDSVLTSFKPLAKQKSAFSEENGMLMLEMMKTAVDQGTAVRIRSKYGLRNAIAGKTGTTQNNKDAWFVGITPKLVHITWVGSDHYEIGFKSTALGQGANAALPMFALLLKEMNRDPYFDPITKAEFEAPTPAVLEKLDCKPVKRDGFFKRLFKNPKKKRKKKFKNTTP